MRKEKTAIASYISVATAAVREFCLRLNITRWKTSCR